MKFENFKENVKDICKKIGRRNFIIAGAVLLIAAAIVVNFAVFSDDKDEGFNYDQSAGMNGDISTTQPQGGNASTEDVDSYFSSVQITRQRTRDEAIEVLQSVVDNQSSTETAKNEALSEINKLATTMETEANIETLIIAKGFEECVAVISGESASVVVKSEGLAAAQISQINEIVYQQSGILPVNITIIER
ncbi:MAG: SpoIIIAH-like family protein [Ruminococcaceae bacterium]|nr:SpoIIIAH-like family protein [Oscillospiraceae bacterium]